MGRTGVQLGFTAAGTAVGAYFGNPMLGAQIGSVVGGIAAALIFPPEDQHGPRLGDVRVADASYGVPIPIVYGTARVAGTLIWTSGIQERATEESAKGGGPSITTYAYFASFAVGLCEGPIQAVRKIWLDTRLVYDASQDNVGLLNARLGQLDPRGIMTAAELGERREDITAEIAKAQSALAMYFGTETQLPDPTIEAWEGAGQVPAHRGMAYVVFQDLALEGYGNRIPSISAEVLTTSAAAYPKREVTPTPFALARDQMIFDSQRQELWAIHRTTLTKVDAMGNEPLWAQTVNAVPWGGKPIRQGVSLSIDVGDDGFVFLTAWAGASGYIVRVDPLTGQVTHRGRWINPATNLPEDHDIFAPGLVVVSAFFVWVTSFGLTHRAYCYTRPGAINPASGEPVVEMLLTGSFDIGGTVPSMRGQFLAVDNEERAWIVCSAPSGGGSTYLLPMNPWGGGAMVNLSGDLAGGEYIAYDAYTNSVILQGYVPGDPFTGQKRLIRVSCETLETTAISAVENFPTGWVGSGWRRGVVGRTIWMANGFYALVAIDVDSLSIVRNDAVTLWPDASGAVSGGAFDPATNAMWVMETGVGFGKYYFDRTAPGTVTLGTIVHDLSLRAGLQAADVVTGALTDVVHGFVVSQRSEARASVEALLGAFLADGVESDWLIRYMHRSLTPVAALTAHDVAAHEPPATELPDRLTPERLNDQALPIRVDVTYADPARDYQDTTQHAKRFQQGQRARSQRDVRTPVILTATQAKQLAEQSLAEAWVSRMTYELSIPYRWTTLDPGDVVTVTLDGHQTVLRLMEITQGANGILECRAVAYDRAIYALSPSVGEIGEGTPPQTIPWNPPTQLLLIDTHLLRDIDDSAGFYLAVAPQGGSGEWSGAVVFSSPDGTAWRQEETITTAVDYGSAATILEAGTPYVFDLGHTVDVTMARGELSSITEAELINGYNGGLLGQEILQWQTATPIGANSWRLSKLLRGRRGTEWAIGQHRVGDRFVVLNPSTLRRKEGGLSEVDVTRYYRAVTLGTDLLSTGGQAFRNTALGLKCYSPEHVRGTRNASNDLTLTWARRTRLGGLWVDGRDVVLGEASEAYEVDMTVAGVVKRTLASATQSVTYTAAQQTADGITPGNPVTATVMQMGTLGRGWPTTATV